MSYLEYWKLERNPFDSVPDPGMYFSSHATVENTVAELLFAIEEGNECLAVVIGEVGLGKTMALRVVLDSLSPDRYRVAFITNPDLTFAQLLREIIGQLNGEKCTTRDKESLLEDFNKILFETADNGKKVLVFIDEGNAMRPANLESLRLLTNMQEDRRNLLTLILAGQPKLGRMLEDPRRANLFQRIGVYCRLEALSSPETVRDYIEHRLEKAGGKRVIFDEAAINRVFEHSHGVPRLINRACKLALKAGETNRYSLIDGDLLGEIAARFENTGIKKHRIRKSDRPAEPKREVESVSAAAEPSIPVQTESTKQRAEERDYTEPPGEQVAEEKPRPVASPQTEQASEPAQPVEPDVSSPVSAHNGGNGTQLGVWKIPREKIESLRGAVSPRDRLRLAGQLAAREITQHPERYRDLNADPVEIWDRLRSALIRLTT